MRKNNFSNTYPICLLLLLFYTISCNISVSQKKPKFNPNNKKNHLTQEKVNTTYQNQLEKFDNKSKNYNGKPNNYNNNTNKKVIKLKNEHIFKIDNKKVFKKNQYILKNILNSKNNTIIINNVKYETLGQLGHGSQKKAYKIISKSKNNFYIISLHKTTSFTDLNIKTIINPIKYIPEKIIAEMKFCEAVKKLAPQNSLDHFSIHYFKNIPVLFKTYIPGDSLKKSLEKGEFDEIKQEAVIRLLTRLSGYPNNIGLIFEDMNASNIIYDKDKKEYIFFDGGIAEKQVAKTRKNILRKNIDNFLQKLPPYKYDKQYNLYTPTSSNKFKKKIKRALYLPQFIPEKQYISLESFKKKLEKMAKKP